MTPCTRCKRGTITGPNGEFMRCGFCNGSGRAPLAAGRPVRARYRVYAGTAGYLIRDMSQHPPLPVWAPAREVGTDNGHWQSLAAATRAATELNAGTLGVLRTDGVLHAAREPRPA